MEKVPRRGERVLEWAHEREKVCVRVCVCVRGRFQLTGNLFLPFSPNKGCDWLLCVRTDL